jgi:hypothetical protein
MVKSMRRGAILAVLLGGSLGAADASAQVFGTFSWRMEPYCNIITLTVTQHPLGYTVDGNDNLCGAGGKLSGATGQVVFNPDGTLGLYFTTVASPAGKTVHVTAQISPATGSGTWTDSVGNSGNFLLGAPGAGSPRPTGASQAAFVFQVTAANICSTGASYAVIDHPLINNDSTAIVLATPNATWPGSGTTGSFVAVPNTQYEVSFWNNPNCAVQIPAGQGRWLIRRLDGNAMPVNVKFSMMAFKQ